MNQFSSLSSGFELLNVWILGFDCKLEMVSAKRGGGEEIAPHLQGEKGKRSKAPHRAAQAYLGFCSGSVRRGMLPSVKLWRNCLVMR